MASKPLEDNGTRTYAAVYAVRLVAEGLLTVTGTIGPCQVRLGRRYASVASQRKRSCERATKEDMSRKLRSPVVEQTGSDTGFLPVFPSLDYPFSQFLKSHNQIAIQVIIFFVRSQVLTAASMKLTAFCDIALCNPVEVDRSGCLLPPSSGR